MAGDVVAAQKELNRKVMGTSGVSGTAIGEKGGKPCLKVYVSGKADVPRSVAGIPVVVEKVGEFRKL